MSEKLSTPGNSSGKRPDYDANDPNPGDRAYQEVVLPDAKIKAREEGINDGQEVLSEVAPIVSLENPLPQETGEKTPEEQWLNAKTPEEKLRLLEVDKEWADSRKLKLLG